MTRNIMKTSHEHPLIHHMRNVIIVEMEINEIATTHELSINILADCPVIVNAKATQLAAALVKYAIYPKKLGRLLRILQVYIPLLNTFDVISLFRYLLVTFPGSTLLTTALKNNVPVCSRFVDIMVDLVGPNAYDKCGESPLYIASCSKEYRHVVDRLLDREAHWDHTDAFGRTALLDIKDRKKHETLQCLCARVCASLEISMLPSKLQNFVRMHKHRRSSGYMYSKNM